MMRWRLAVLLGEYQEQTGHRLSYRALGQAAGLSKTTIAAMANNDMKRADLDTMDAILNYMSKQLDRKLTTDDLLHFEEDV